MPVLESSTVTFCESRHAGDPTVVWLKGDHDMSTAAALSETITSAIALDADLVIDLSGVQFMGVVTVGLLSQTREQLALISRSLTLRSPSPRAERVLALCGLDLDPAGLPTNR